VNGVKVGITGRPVASARTVATAHTIATAGTIAAAGTVLAPVVERRGTPPQEEIMPQSDRPITDRPKVEDESTGDPKQVEERHGKHREEDPGTDGRGSEKAGTNRDSGSGRPGGPKESRQEP
jgi:hypothetical protein